MVAPTSRRRVGAVRAPTTALVLLCVASIAAGRYVPSDVTPRELDGGDLMHGSDTSTGGVQGSLLDELSANPWERRVLQQARLEPESITDEYLGIPQAGWRGSLAPRTANARCKGRPDGVYAVPESPDCNIYLTCCSGRAFQRQCKDFSLPIPEYGPDKGMGIFDAQSQLCLSYTEAGRDVSRCRSKVRGAVPAKPKLYQPTSDLPDFCKLALGERQKQRARALAGKVTEVVSAQIKAGGKAKGKVSKPPKGKPQVPEQAVLQVLETPSLSSQLIQTLADQTVATNNETLLIAAALDPLGSGFAQVSQIAFALPAPTPDATTKGFWQKINNPDLNRSSTGIVAIHAALIPKTSKVWLAARVQPDGGTNAKGDVCPYNVPYEPNMDQQMMNVYDYATGQYQRAYTAQAPFCMAQSHLTDGRLIAAGGNEDGLGNGDACNADPLIVQEGRDAIRLLSLPTLQPATSAYKLSGFRWYPTQLTLPDNRVLICLGKTSERDVINPTCDVFDGNTNRVVKLAIPIDFPVGELYPTINLLNWVPATGEPLGLYYLYFFAGNVGKIFTLDAANNLVPRNDLPLPAWPTALANYFAAYSGSAPSVILPITFPYSTAVQEVVMFGGFQFAPGCRCQVPASNKAVRKRLSRSTRTTAWALETMPTPRHGCDGVLLPNGQIVIVNGAQQGVMGGGIGGGGSAYLSQTCAWLYNPKAAAGARFTVLACSDIIRHYHSTALLTIEGDVLVMGSEHRECIPGCTADVPSLQQFQAERFTTPFGYLPNRPTITSAQEMTAAMGTTFTVSFTGTVTTNGGCILYPGAVTHQTDMSQRLVNLQEVSRTTVAGGGTITFRLPSVRDRVANPGVVYFFLLNGLAWSEKAIWLTLTPGDTTGPITGGTVPKFGRIGCFKDAPTIARALPNLLNPLAQGVAGGGDPAATQERCAQLALAAGYKYFGLQYYGECWAGNNLALATGYGSADTCTTACNGNTFQNCGGPDTNNVFEVNPAVINPAPPPSPLLVIASPPPPVVVIPPPPALTNGPGFIPVGCYGDDPIGGRKLPFLLNALAGGAPNGGDATSTHEKCAGLAAAGAYPVFGLQYYGECWAGDSITIATSLGPSPNCTTPCNGNMAQICGGPDTNSVFRRYKPEGCFLDDATTPATRRIPTLLNVLPDATSTIQKCAKLAADAGFTVFGLQNSGECYGGNNLVFAQGLGAATTCTTACTGDATQNCGGIGANNVFTIIPAA